MNFGGSGEGFRSHYPSSLGLDKLTLNITSDSKSSNQNGSSGGWLGSPKSNAAMAAPHSSPYSSHIVQRGPSTVGTDHDYFASQPQKNTIHAYQQYWQQYDQLLTAVINNDAAWLICLAVLSSPSLKRIKKGCPKCCFSSSTPWPEIRRDLDSSLGRVLRSLPTHHLLYRCFSYYQINLILHIQVAIFAVNYLSCAQSWSDHLQWSTLTRFYFTLFLSVFYIRFLSRIPTE